MSNELFRLLRDENTQEFFAVFSACFSLLVGLFWGMYAVRIRRRDSEASDNYVRATAKLMEGAPEQYYKEQKRIAGRMK